MSVYQWEPAPEAQAVMDQAWDALAAVDPRLLPTGGYKALRKAVAVAAVALKHGCVGPQAQETLIQP